MIKQNFNKKSALDSDDFNTEKFLADHLHHEVYIEKNDENQLVYKVEILVGDFNPNEIKLKLKGTKLVIHALKQVNKIKYELRGETESNYDFKNFNNETRPPKISNLREHEEFKREISLPNFVKAETIVSFLETYEDKSENTLILEGQIDPIKLDTETSQNGIPKLKYQSPQKNNKTVTNNVNTNRKSSRNSSDNSIDQLEEFQMENNSSGVLKYKFDLKDFESNDINISIKNKEILLVSASNGINKDFYREVKLPKNSEIHNIRNCFDESIGLLRIEIPLATNKNQDPDDSEVSKINSNKNRNEDKYLELIFDLHDFKFDSINVQKNDENKNILIVKAIKLNPSILNECINNNNKNSTTDTINKNSFVRKYILPDWVSTKNIKIHEEKKIINGDKKNLLILHIPFV